MTDDKGTDYYSYIVLWGVMKSVRYWFDRLGTIAVTCNMEAK